MNQRRRQLQRRAFATAISLLTLIVISAMLAITWEFAARSLKRERRMALETRVEAALQSARAWSRQHRDDLRQSGSIKLPIERIMPADATGELELQVDASQPMQVICKLALSLGGVDVQRVAHWADE